MSTYDPIGMLSRFRANLLAAERRGHADKYLYDDAGTLESDLERMKAGKEALAEAKKLYERAMNLSLRG